MPLIYAITSKPHWKALSGRLIPWGKMRSDVSCPAADKQTVLRTETFTLESLCGRYIHNVKFLFIFLLEHFFFPSARASGGYSCQLMLPAEVIKFIWLQWDQNEAVTGGLRKWSRKCLGPENHVLMRSLQTAQLGMIGVHLISHFYRHLKPVGLTWE